MSKKDDPEEEDDLRLDLSHPAALGAFARGDIGNAIVASTPGGIERQEALGQKAFNNSDVLPIDLRDITRPELQALGFSFGQPVDDLFQQAMLPAGWAKRATNHDMWSEIVDDTGTVRANVFYKAAFYDRSAVLSWVRGGGRLMSYTFRGLTLPPHLEASLRRYVEDGVPTGHFLQACIENNLIEAVGRADEESLAALPAIVGYLVNECPAYCWGFEGAMRRWQETRRHFDREPASPQPIDHLE